MQHIIKKYSLPVRFVSMLCIPLTACNIPVGPKNMRRDRIAYDQEFNKGQKQEMLLNIVALRYADTPTVLETTQIIANRSYTRNFMGSIMGDPWHGVGGTNLVGGTASMGLADNPTVTYQPVAGTEFASNLLEPLHPETLLPLILSGAALDVMFSLAVQSVNGLTNMGVLNDVGSTSSNVKGENSYEKFKFLAKSLRVLQKNSAVSFKIVEAFYGKTKYKKSYIIFPSTGNKDLDKLQAQVKKLLNLNPRATTYDLVYGQYPRNNSEVAIMTRSMMSVFKSVSNTIDVPKAAIDDGETLPSLPIDPDTVSVRVHCGEKEPKKAYVSILYDDTWYWIEKNDLKSKHAFSMLQLINAMARTGTASGAVVTIPAH